MVASYRHTPMHTPALAEALRELERATEDAKHAPLPTADETLVDAALRHARHEAVVRAAAQRGYALTGTSVLDGMARGEIPSTKHFSGPFVA